MSGSGGVSVKAGPSPRLGGGRFRLRREARRQVRKRGERDPEESSITSALLCGDCGQLGWPTPEGGAHPHRQEESTALARQAPCSHCGQRSWIDLGLPSMAMALREEEEARVVVRRRGPWPVALAATLGLLGGGWIGLLMMTPELGLLVGVLCGLIGGLVVYRDVGPRQALPPLPARWSMALPPPGESTEVVRGPARASAERLAAPLTGRPCVAYEVGVRYDVDTSAPAGSWALLEQKVAPMTVDERAVEPEVTHLEVPREHLGSSATWTLSEAAQVFLQQRGLGLDGMTLELFETVVEADAAVELAVAREGATLRASRQAALPAGA